MAKFDDYLYFADLAYEQKENGPPNAGGWTSQKWEWATWYGNGFQGGIFVNQSDGEVIVAFSGTKGGPTTAPISQNTANARIGLNVIPNMAGAAYAMVRWAQQHNPGAKISIVGHSLGGGLAQVVGNWTGVPFISLNGPGMTSHLKMSAFNIAKPRQMIRSIRSNPTGLSYGLSLSVKGDFVGNFGRHVGHFISLDQGGFVGTTKDTHSISAVRRGLIQQGWLQKTPSQVSNAWPT